MLSSDFGLFLKKFLLYIFPIFCVFGVFDMLAIMSGELTLVKTVVEEQKEHKDRDILFGRKSVEQEIKKYKYNMLLDNPSDILAIGSSRVLGMRKEFFQPYYSFINLGSIAHNIGDLEDLSKRLALAESPKIIFLSLDYYWFGEKREMISSLTKELDESDVLFQWKSHLFATRYLIFTLFKDYKKFLSYFDRRNIYRDSFGFQARNGDGYRADGSYFYGTYIKELTKNYVYEDREQPSIIERVRDGSSSYVFDNTFDQVRIQILDKILKELKQKNYYVIGLSLPFSTEVYKELNENPRHSVLFNQYRDSMTSVFKDNGFYFFDYSDIKSLNLTDLYMFDGVHGSDTMIGYVLYDIFSKLDKSILEKREDLLIHLQKALKDKRTSSFQIIF